MKTWHVMTDADEVPAVVPSDGRWTTPRSWFWTSTSSLSRQV